MANYELLNNVENLVELENAIDALKAEAEEIRNSIKSEMEVRGLEEMEVGNRVVRYTSVLSTRFDTRNFKLKMGEELYKAFTKEVASKRVSIA